MLNLQHLLSVLDFIKKSTLVLLPIWASLPSAVLALPVPDNTLGTQNTLLSPGFVQIEGGTTVGQNLFHSFESFNISTGESVFFLSPIEINNVFSRVTGDGPSDIDGVLGTLGSDADLFLINPNGVVFGPNASLDVQGSFVVTTADAVELGPDGIFSASEPSSDQLLSVNPSAFFFSELPGEIASQAQSMRSSLNDPSFTVSGLQVPNGEALVLLGGPITLDGGEINALGGRVEIVAVAESGRIDFAAAEASLSLPNDLERADIEIQNGSRIETTAGGDGNIVIHGADFELADSSFIRSGISSGSGATDSQAGDIQINAAGTIVLSDNSAVQNIVSGIGRGGNIEISSSNLELTNGSQLIASTDGVGHAGNVIVQAQNTVRLDGARQGGQFTSAIFSDVDSNGEGMGSNVEIFTHTLEVINGAQLIASTLGVGDAGNVIIQAQDTVRFDGTTPDGQFVSAAFSDVSIGGTGAGGNVEISTGTLEVTNGASLNAGTLGIGDAGNVIIQAQERVLFDGSSPDGIFASGAFNNVSSNGTGAGGNVEISTETLEVTNGASLDVRTFGIGDAGNIIIQVRNLEAVNQARLGAATFGIGDAGNIIIQAQDAVLFDRNSIAFSSVGIDAEGTGGNIEISARALDVINDSALFSATLGVGNAGNVNIQIQERALFKDSGVFNSIITEGTGGNINVSAQTLELIDSQLSTLTSGAGDAGNVSVQAEGQVLLDNSMLFTSATDTANGNSGNVEVTAQNLTVINNDSGLLAFSLGNGSAGNVSIRVEDTVRFNNSLLGASTLLGPNGIGIAGNVEITARILEVTNGSNLAAFSSGIGNSGDVIIQAQDRVLFDDSSVLNEISSEGEGIGGNVEITTQTLEVLNGSTLSVSTSGTGSAGNVVIQAQDSVLFDDSNVLSQVRLGATGTGGNIEIAAQTLEINNNAGVFTNTFSTGKAGNVLIDVVDHVQLNSGQIVVESASDSTAGDIEIIANEVRLENNSLLSAESDTVNGGNISLDLDTLLLLRDESQVTATAGNAQAGGNGGNITITAPFIVAIPTENSDITANAFEGRGGEINISTQGVFGIEPSPNLTPLSDITASSTQGVSGVITVNSFDTSFIQNDLTSLPNALLNVESLVANSCIARSQESGVTFTITGDRVSNTLDDNTPVYTTGNVQIINTPATTPQTANVIIEPSGIYQTADGRLVISRECSHS